MAAIFAEGVFKNNASYIKKPKAKNGIYILSCDMTRGNLVFTCCSVRPWKDANSSIIHLFWNFPEVNDFSDDNLQYFFWNSDDTIQLAHIFLLCLTRWKKPVCFCLDNTFLVASTKLRRCQISYSRKHSSDYKQLKIWRKKSIKHRHSNAKRTWTKVAYLTFLCSCFVTLIMKCI